MGLKLTLVCVLMRQSAPAHPVQAIELCSIGRGFELSFDLE